MLLSPIVKFSISQRRDIMLTSANADHSSGFWRRNLDKFGIGGSVFAALCCLGFPALLSILSAVGLGFIVTDTVLIPMLLVFLAVTLAGLYFGTRHHHEPWALVLGVISALATFVFIGVVQNRILAGVSIAGLVIASVLNVWLRTRQLHAE
jgi:mercuric ion transport protein